VLAQYLPHRLKIAGKVIKVRIMSEAEFQEKSVWGLYDSFAGEIAIYPVMTPSNMLDTLIHEVLHAVFDGWNLQDSDEEERTVHTMATALQTLMVDNRNFTKFLKRAIKESRQEHKHNHREDW
jgi:uncharacterized protein YqeY